jgi:hypothetical protein
MGKEYFTLSNTGKFEKWVLIFLLFNHFIGALNVLILANEKHPFSIVYSLIVLLITVVFLLRFYNIKPFNAQKFVEVSDEGIQYRTSMFGRKKSVKWNEFQRLKVDDLKLNFYSEQNKLEELDLGWVPMNIAYTIKRSILSRSDIQSKKLEVA